MNPSQTQRPQGQPRRASALPIRAQVALDATPHSASVIQSLTHLLRPGEAACDLLYVLPVSVSPDRRFAAMDAEAEVEITRLVNEQFDDYARTLSGHQLPVNTRHFLKEAPTTESSLLDHLENDTPDLLVMGMQSPVKTRHKRHISSTSYAVATHAECSVLIIKKELPATGTLKVLFATDGSAHAQQAAQKLTTFLRREQTEITVFSAVSVNYYTLPMVEPFVDYRPLEEAMTGDAMRTLAEATQIFEDAGYTVSQSYFCLGDPVDTILEEAEKLGADLIVTGSHGTGGRLSSWLLGSVSSKVLEYSPVSVGILK